MKGKTYHWIDNALRHPDGRIVRPGELRSGEERKRDFSIAEDEKPVDDRQLDMFEEEEK